MKYLVIWEKYLEIFSKSITNRTVYWFLQWEECCLYCVLCSRWVGWGYWMGDFVVWWRWWWGDSFLWRFKQTEKTSVYDSSTHFKTVPWKGRENGGGVWEFEWMGFGALSFDDACYLYVPALKYSGTTKTLLYKDFQLLYLRLELSSYLKVATSMISVLLSLATSVPFSPEIGTVLPQHPVQHSYYCCCKDFHQWTVGSITIV